MAEEQVIDWQTRQYLMEEGHKYCDTEKCYFKRKNCPAWMDKEIKERWICPIWDFIDYVEKNERERYNPKRD